MIDFFVGPDPLDSVQGNLPIFFFAVVPNGEAIVMLAIADVPFPSVLGFELGVHDPEGSVLFKEFDGEKFAGPFQGIENVGDFCLRAISVIKHCHDVSPFL